jgi:flagella basal body P-ring formation protein FlgA
MTSAAAALALACALARSQEAPPAPPAPPPPAPDRLLVVLRPRVQVTHTPVLLPDVAELAGPLAEIERFSKLELCPAPVAGKPRLVTPAGVRLAARLAGLDLERDQLVGAPQVEIVANWRELSAGDLAAEAQKWLLLNGEELGDKILTELSVKPEGIGLLEGGGAPAFECAFVGRPRGQGQVQVKVSVLQEGTLLGERVATFNVRRFGRQLRLLTNVRRGETVAASQVVVVDGEWTSVPGTPLLDPRELSGRVALRDLAAGAVLVREGFELPVLVDRGGQVRVVLREGALEIVAVGVAQRAGRRGETIPVLNPTTQKLLQAELIDRRPTGEVVALMR